MGADGDRAGESAGESVPRLVVVTLSTLAGNTHEVQVPEAATVAQAKEEIERLLGFRPAEQRLVLGGQILDDDLKPFGDLQPRSVVQLIRIPFVSLKRFAQKCPGLANKEVSDLSQDDLLRIFKDAAHEDQPEVCLEILSHSSWGPGVRSAPGLLESVAVGGLARVFQALVDDEFYGRAEGVLDSGFMALHTAAKRGLSLQCQALLASPNFSAAAERSTKNGATALHHAASEAILRLLLSHKALAAEECINMQDRRGCTCLHYASTESACLAILEQPSFIALDAVDAYGMTVLHTARVPGVCSAIIQHPLFTAINHRDEKGAPPLHYLVRTTAALPLLEARRSAILQGVVPATGTRAEGGDELVGTHDSALPHAVLHLDIDAVDARGRTALFFVRSGDVARALFEAGFSNVAAVERKSGRTALQECRNPDVIRQIVGRPEISKQSMRIQEAFEEAQASGLGEAAGILRQAMLHDKMHEPSGEQVALIGGTQQGARRLCTRLPCSLL
mmetsp:Transcript_116112/g.335357  ORF Transcript_116112/g.335357 Transcript_116112/m.335357 type:complete len:506 (-) Transcript_116112:37-1554(-)